MEELMELKSVQGKREIAAKRLGKMIFNLGCTDFGEKVGWRSW
jgi:hypothetical protein